MKKTFYLFLLAIIALNCSKIKTDAKLLSPDNLSQDSTFSNFVLATYDYLKFLRKSINSNGLSQSDVMKKLQNLSDSKMRFDAQLPVIDQIFLTKVSGRLILHMSNYKNAWPKIMNSYAQITPEVLEREISEVFRSNLIKGNEVDVQQFSTTDEVEDVDGGCGWRYYLCSAAATAGAILCHAGCNTTALATTAGLGIPVCVAACGTLQAFAIVQCADNYCK